MCSCETVLQLSKILTLTPAYDESNLDVSIIPLHFSSDDEEKTESASIHALKLPDKFGYYECLPITEILKQLDSLSNVLKTALLGDKENVYLFVENENNIKNGHTC